MKPHFVVMFESDWTTETKIHDQNKDLRNGPASLQIENIWLQFLFTKRESTLHKKSKRPQAIIGLFKVKRNENKGN